MKGLPRKRTVAAIILIVGALAFALMAIRFIRHRLEYAVTDAVFIRTDSMINLGFDGVNGRISTMSKNDGDGVIAGEELAAIDASEYRLTVTRLEAELAEARSELTRHKLSRERLSSEAKINIAIATDQVIQLQAEKAAAEATVASLSAVVAQLERDRDRYAGLFEAKAIAGRKVEDLTTELTARREEQNSLRRKVAALEAAEEAAREKVGLASTNGLVVKEASESVIGQSQKIAALTASLAQAQEKLGKCTIKSPIEGRIARRFTSPGDVVETGQTVYAVVNPKDVFAVALLEENKLNGVTAGASVTLTLDAYPDQKFNGVVQEVMPASAATFALVPRDISAGEFTKVSQRIPIRIALTDKDLSLLRVGMGGEVEIKRRDQGQ